MRRFGSLGLALLVALALPACSGTYDYGYAVALKMVAGPSLGDATVAGIRTLRLDVSGAETASEQLATTAPPFAKGREERVLYRPLASGGLIALSLTAFDAQGAAVGFGQTMVTLEPKKTVSATIELGAQSLPMGPDFGVPPPAVVTPSMASVLRLGTVSFKADVPVTWSVKEASGGTIDQNGTYTAPGDAGTFTVVATRTDYPVSTDVPVTVGFGAIDLLAGGLGGAGSLDGQGAAARLGPRSEEQLAVDSFGNLYLPERNNGTVRKIDTSGNVTTLAGTPGLLAVVDGNGAQARFLSPYGVALDASFGNLYVSECGAQVIRRISLTPPYAVTTIAGTAGMVGPPNGLAGAAARFNCPAGMAFDNGAPGGPSLYVADDGNNVIQQVRVADGQTSTIAGNGTAGATDTNPGATPPTVGEFHNPVGLALVTSGAKRLYVSDQANQSVRIVTLGGINPVSTLANVTTPIAQIVADQVNGLLYLAGNTNQTVKQVTFGGAITTLAGASGQAGYLDGNGGAARFNFVEGIALSGGNLYVVDGDNSVLRKLGLAAPFPVTTFVGTALQSGVQNSNGADGSTARFSHPVALDTDGAGNVYVADYANHTVRKVAVGMAGSQYTAVVTTPAGQPGSASGANVGTPTPGVSAQFNHPFCVRFVAPSTLFVCDHDNGAIRAVDLASPSFTVSPVATGLPGPRGLAPMANGDLYFTAEGQQVYLWDHVERKARALWGSPTGATGTADGGGADAAFHDPTGIVFDGDHALYVADRGNDTLRKIDLETGQVTTVAGMAGQPGTDDGALGTSRLWLPWQLTWHNGYVYVADGGSDTIRRYDPATGLVTTVLGTPTQGGFRVGPAPGFLNDPAQVVFLATGEMVVSSNNGEDVLMVVH